MEQDRAKVLTWFGTFLLVAAFLSQEACSQMVMDMDVPSMPVLSTMERYGYDMDMTRRDVLFPDVVVTDVIVPDVIEPVVVVPEVGPDVIVNPIPPTHVVVVDGVYRSMYPALSSTYPIYNSEFWDKKKR